MLVSERNHECSNYPFKVFEGLAQRRWGVKLTRGKLDGGGGGGKLTRSKLGRGGGGSFTEGGCSKRRWSSRSIEKVEKT